MVNIRGSNPWPPTKFAIRNGVFVMPTIYLDMDGVVADFDTATSKIIGRSHSTNEPWPPADWAKLRPYQRLYLDLPLMPDAKQLVESVMELANKHDYEVRFLTAVPKDNDFPWAFQDKMIWKQKHFGDIPIWFGPYSADKHFRSKSGDILIDDRTSNIDEWTQAGGVGILHNGDVNQSLDKLRTILQMAQ